jgi:8-oxo-dGTP pyrophosphatase MutT (NUDIX family)
MKTKRKSLSLRESIFENGCPRKYWGRGGAGIVFYCSLDETILLGKRSNWVTDPGTWGYPGGAVDEGWQNTPIEDPVTDEDVFFETATREASEECGSLPPGMSFSSRTTFEDEGFCYVTYLCKLSYEQKSAWRPTPADGEMDEWDWFELDDLPSPLHPKLVSTLQRLGLLSEASLVASSYGKR